MANDICDANKWQLEGDSIFYNFLKNNNEKKKKIIFVRRHFLRFVAIEFQFE